MGTQVPYDISSAGISQPVCWGIDTAWLWSWWPLRATNHMQECAELGRVTLDPRVTGSYTELASEQAERLDLQLSWLQKSGVKKLWLMAGNASGTDWQTNYRTPFVTDIELAVKYLQLKGFNVIAISPFNEPDYGVNRAPNATEMATVARLIRQRPTLANIDVAGPSTLNPDYGLAWWDAMKGAVQIGNTHQLAGSFDSFAGFYAAVKTSGKISAGDEMHNINDALIGMNYGMAYGIWWSDYGSYTRAELGRASNDGERIGYAENRGAWTSAAVFRRRTEPMVEAFLGTSERQAGESAFTFVSQDRMVYCDGNGPCYDYTQATPGGTGYGAGQTNAENVVEITHGEDVPIAPLKGTFKIVNKATGKLLTVSALQSDATIRQAKESRTANQSWVIEPIAPRAAPDMAHVTIRAANNTKFYMDALKYAADNGARVLLFDGDGNECERWHLHYKGNGYYTITNYDSGLSLEGSANNSEDNTTGIVQWARTGTDRQLWRLVPAEAIVENEAPSAPAGLNIEGRPGSIRLTWTANDEPDMLGYMVYRYNDAADEWETLARCVASTEFTDNYCAKGQTYRYRLRAIDRAWNLSAPSDEAAAATISEDAIIGEWHLLENMKDYSGNQLTAAATSISFDATDAHAGAVFDGTQAYIALPYHVADMQAMTFCAWVKVSNATAWQRIFDFGRSTDNYLMLTPSNGSRLRFEICKDGIKQGVNATKRMVVNSWTHVAVTLGNDGAKIYLNGELNAQSSSVTFRPADVRPVLSYLGRSMFDADPLFKGTIGDVRLYNHVLGDASIRALYNQDQLNAAAELAANPMNKEVRMNLHNALNATQEAMAQAGSTEEVATALATLAQAMDAARPSVEVYCQLGLMLSWSAKQASLHPQDDADAKEVYLRGYDMIQRAYADGEYADADIPDACKALRAATNTYLMADVSRVTTRFTDITHLLFNPDFADGTANGWDIEVNSESGYLGTVDFGCFEVWNHTFTLAQTLPGMPAGEYRLQAQAFYRNGSKENSGSTDVKACLFIGDEATAPIAAIGRSANAVTAAGEWFAYASNKKVPNNMEAAAAAFNNLERYKPSAIVNTLSAVFAPDADDDDLTLGLQKHDAVDDDWTIVNYFTLSYKAREVEDAVQDVVDSEKGHDSLYNGTCYDLFGRQIRTTDNLCGLPVGIYVIGGRKVIKR